MFTGIIEACVPVRSFAGVGSGARLVVPAPALPEGVDEWRVERGQSIAVAGCCLTVAELLGPDGAVVPDRTDGADMVFDLSEETIACTWFEQLAPGRGLNLERAMHIGDRIDGHLVSGHVDGGGRIVEILAVGDGGRVFTFEVDAGLDRYLVEKGSVTIDGISLTVVEPEGVRFRVAVIPLTLEVTNLGTAEVGQRVNVEADMIGKWIEHLVLQREA